MHVTFCNINKRINSTKQVTSEQLAAGAIYDNVVLKQLTNIDNPTLWIDGADDDIYTYNYAYIQEWGRYYFVRSCDLRHDKIYKCDLELDDLATYKTEILATTAYIIYSTSNFNRWIRDDRCPIIIHGSSYVSSQSAIVVDNEPLFEASDNETVVITTVSQNYGIYSWVLTENQLRDVMAALSDNDSIFDALSKQFGDAMGSIISVQRLPIRAAAIQSNNTSFIQVGKYTLSTSAGYHELATRHVYATGSIGIPATYTDFRFTEPYCKAKISIPFIGVVDFPLGELAPDGGIDWRLDIDILTGLITYTFFSGTIAKPIASYSGNCGGIVPIATNQIANVGNTVAGLTGGVIGAGASLLSGNPVPALIGGISAVANGFYSAAQTSSSVIGSYSGGRSEYTSRVIKLTVEKFLTSNEPDNLTAVEGRPVCKVDTLTNYTGYIRTQGFSISLTANKYVIDSINAKLDAGIYIE